MKRIIFLFIVCLIGEIVWSSANELEWEAEMMATTLKEGRVPSQESVERFMECINKENLPPYAMLRSKEKELEEVIGKGLAKDFLKVLQKIGLGIDREQKISYLLSFINSYLDD